MKRSIRTKVAALLKRGVTDTARVAALAGCSRKLADYYAWEAKNPRDDYFARRHRRLYETSDAYREIRRQRSADHYRNKQVKAEVS